MDAAANGMRRDDGPVTLCCKHRVSMGLVGDDANVATQRRIDLAVASCLLHFVHIHEELRHWSEGHLN